MWNKRLKGCNRDINVWERILSIRSLILKPNDDIDIYLEYTNIARQAGRNNLSLNILVNLLGFNPHDTRI